MPAERTVDADRMEWADEEVFPLTLPWTTLTGAELVRPLSSPPSSRCLRLLAITAEDVVDVAAGDTRCTKQAISHNSPHTGKVLTARRSGGDRGKALAKGLNDGDGG